MLGHSMAEPTSRGATRQPPIKLEEAATIPTQGDRARGTVTRRQWTLIAITGVLNVLFFSSLLCIFTQIYEIANDPGDTTNIASEVLILTSALATLAYINLHCIFSLKQRIWRHQGGHRSGDKKTSYIAVRFAAMLCTLWLLTSGWNMIVVARRPICLPEVEEFHSWEIGKTCQLGRVGIAFAMFALMASCALFGMLATVSRPFEAHLFNYRHVPPTTTPTGTPNVSPRPSLSRSVSVASDKYDRRRVSLSTHRSRVSYVSNIDVDTLDLNSTSGHDGIIAPAPLHSLGLGIFTSHAQPPPLPAAYATPSRVSSVEPPSSTFQPSLSTPYLPLPPRMSTLAPPGSFVPASIPAQYATSNWRAVHPSAPSPLVVAASRSQSHLPHTKATQNFAYRARYSRSSVSLTRPHRLSSTVPSSSVGWSSRSGSTSPEKNRSSNDDSESESRASGSLGRHARHVSAPEVTAGAQASRRARKTQLQAQVEQGKAAFRSLSAAILPSVIDADKSNVTKKDEEIRSSIDRFIRVRKMRSEGQIRAPSPTEAVTREPPIANRASQSPAASDVKSGNTEIIIATILGPSQKGGTNFEDIKNKPLPRIVAT